MASADRRLLEMGDVYRLSGWRKFAAIVVPSTLPYLVAGMKVGFGLALKVSVVAEIFGVTSGIGYVITPAARSSPPRWSSAGDRDDRRHDPHTMIMGEVERQQDRPPGAPPS
jgi:ABC-type spermidine/putrescine transport system permease subunit I